MTCLMCKGTMRETISVFTVDLGGCVVIVKNVPSSACGQCGEISYSDEVTKRLEQIVHGVKGATSAEIAVFCYTKKAA